MNETIMQWLQNNAKDINTKTAVEIYNRYKQSTDNPISHTAFGRVLSRNLIKRSTIRIGNKVHNRYNTELNNTMQSITITPCDHCNGKGYTTNSTDTQ